MRVWIASEKKMVRELLHIKDLETAKETDRTLYFKMMEQINAGQNFSLFLQKNMQINTYKRNASQYT